MESSLIENVRETGGSSGMLFACWAIVIVLVAMFLVFMRAHKKEYAVAIVPLIVLPFIHILSNPLAHLLDPLLPLTLPELRKRFARHRCRAWFSEDFYCQYATYQETEQLHLILYDNAASVQAKLDLAAELGLAGALVCWEEISGFQPPVW
mgnify:CR=1 FL=1